MNTTQIIAVTESARHLELLDDKHAAIEATATKHLIEMWHDSGIVFHVEPQGWSATFLKGATS